MLLESGISHTNDGRFFINNDPEAVIARTKANGVEIPVDVNHGIEIGSSEPSMGWVTDYEVRDGAIWARVDWTDLGREQVLGKYYRYISPALNHDQDGNVIDFQSVALTNKPALVMPALANTQKKAKATASQHPQQTEIPMDEETLAKWRKILNLAEDADEATVQAAIDKAAEAVDADPAEEEEEELSAEEQAAADAEAEEAAALAAAEAEAAALPENPDPENFVHKADYDAVVEQLAASAEATADAPTEAEISETVETAMASGRIAPATKAHHTAMCSTRKGLDSFKAMVKIAPKIVATTKSKKAMASKELGKPSLSEDQLAMCSKMGLDPKAYAATLNNAK